MGDHKASATIYPNGNIEYGSGTAQQLSNGGVMYSNGISTGVAPDTNGHYAAVVWSGDRSTVITDPNTVKDIEEAIRAIVPSGVSNGEQTLADNLIHSLLNKSQSRTR